MSSKAAVREPVHQPEDIREPVRAGEGERTRMRKGGQTHDRFYIPPEMIPDGISFEWKRLEVMGKPDYHYERELQEQGWRSVPHSMVPGLFAPLGASGAVIVDGMILMERPTRLTEEAKQEDYQRAVGALRSGEHRMAEAPPGTLGRTRPTINTTHEPMVVEE